MLRVNRARENPCVLREMFCELDVRRKSIVTLALSKDNRKIIVRYFVNRDPGLDFDLAGGRQHFGPGRRRCQDISPGLAVL